MCRRGVGDGVGVDVGVSVATGPGGTTVGVHETKNKLTTIINCASLKKGFIANLRVMALFHYWSRLGRRFLAQPIFPLHSSHYCPRRHRLAA